MEDQRHRDTRGYIFETYEELKELKERYSKKLSGNDLYSFLESVKIPARIGDLFFKLIADDIRTHGWKTWGMPTFVEKYKTLDDKQLIRIFCQKWGYTLLMSVLYRAGNVWK